MNILFVTLFVLVSCLLIGADDHSWKTFDFMVDLTSGTVEDKQRKMDDFAKPIQWFSPLTGDGECAKQGVLKLNYANAEGKKVREKLVIDMWFNNTKGFVFNIGDSEIDDGKGYSIDITHHFNAEVTGNNKAMILYGGVHDSNRGKKRTLNRVSYILKERLSVIVMDGMLVWNDWEHKLSYYIDSHLFALSGQTEELDRKRGQTGKRYTKPEYDIYFAMNRVVSTPRSKGSGLCKVYFKWL